MAFVNEIRDISAEDLKIMQQENESFQLLDVRQAEEIEIVKITPHIHIPIDDLMTAYTKLEKSIPIVVLCHKGGRSLLACQFLKEKGFQVMNLLGGIDAWAKRIDPKLSLY